MGSTPSSCTKFIFLNLLFLNFFIFLKSEDNKNLKITKNFNVNINYGSQKDIYLKDNPIEKEINKDLLNNKILNEKLETSKKKSFFYKIYKISKLISFKTIKYSFLFLLIYIFYKLVSKKIYQYKNIIKKFVV